MKTQDRKGPMKTTLKSQRYSTGEYETDLRLSTSENKFILRNKVIYIWNAMKWKI